MSSYLIISKYLWVVNTTLTDGMAVIPTLVVLGLA